MKPLIGVPVHNDFQAFKEMIDSLLMSTSYFDRIVIIESGSTDGTKEFTDSLPKDKFEVIHTDKEGPLKAYNRLFEIARKENKDLLITQTDVIFPKLYRRDWLHLMSQIAETKGIGMVVPINGGGVSGPDYLNGLHWVGGWCTYISNKCWSVFWGYDEKYPMGYGVDIDMTYLIGKYFNIVQMNYWVDHHMQNQRDHDNHPDSQKAMKEAGNYFKQKWKK